MKMGWCSNPPGHNILHGFHPPCTSPPEKIIHRYKELAKIERGWRALKSALLLRPIHRRTEDRIKAHVFVCLLALRIERLMRNRLKTLSVSKALDRL